MAVRGSRWTVPGVLVAFVFGLAPFAVAPAAHKPVTAKVTWTREVSEIFGRRCVSCHRDEGFGGFPLTTFEQARPWAVAIKQEVLAGTMPPWSAAAGVGHFANDPRLTRHELELIAAWVDGGAPYSADAPTPAFAGADDRRESSTPTSDTADAIAGSLAVPLAPAAVDIPTERTAGVTLALPDGMTLVAWTFEPGLAANVARVDLELGSRWIGTWVPGEGKLAFPSDTGAPLTTEALFTARIAYEGRATDTIDRSRLRIWMTKDARPKTLREATVVRSWRATAATELVAVRPARDHEAVQLVVRHANGRVDPIGVFSATSNGRHPTYRFVRPVALQAGARVESTGPVRLLYSGGATRSVNPKVRRRPRR